MSPSHAVAAVVVSTLLLITAGALLTWCLRVEPTTPGTQRRSGLALTRDAAALLMIGVVVLMAAPTSIGWEPVLWVARRAAQAEQEKLHAQQREKARRTLQELEVRLPHLSTAPSQAPQGTNPQPFPWKDMDDATAQAFSRASVEKFDRQLRDARLLTPDTSAVAHHCQVRLWRHDGGDESRPVAVITLLPDEYMHVANRAEAYDGSALSSAGEPLLLNLMGGQTVVGDNTVLTLALRSFLLTVPPTRVVALDASGTRPQAMLQPGNSVLLELDQPLARSTYQQAHWARVLPLADGRLQLNLQTAASLMQLHGLATAPGEGAEEKQRNWQSFLQAIARPDDVPAHGDAGYLVRMVDGGLNPTEPLRRLVLDPYARDYDRWMRSHVDPSTEDATVALSLSWVQRGPDHLLHYATNFTGAPQIDARLRCTDAPPGQVEALLRWLRGE